MADNRRAGLGLPRDAAVGIAAAAGIAAVQGTGRIFLRIARCARRCISGFCGIPAGGIARFLGLSTLTGAGAGTFPGFLIGITFRVTFGIFFRFSAVFRVLRSVAAGAGFVSGSRGIPGSICRFPSAFPVSCFLAAVRSGSRALTVFRGRRSCPLMSCAP